MFNQNHSMLSVSDLSAYDYCARKLYLVKVLKLKETYTARLSKGKIKHEIFEKINEVERLFFASNDHAEPFFKSKYNTIILTTLLKYKEEIKKFEVDYDEFKKEVIEFFSKIMKIRINQINDFLFKNRGKKDWRLFEPKTVSEQFITNDKLGIRGIVDFVEVYKDKNIPVEIKSGSIPKQGVWPSHQMQIAAYIKLLEHEYGVTCPKGVVYYIDHDKKVDVWNNEFLDIKINKRIDDIKGMIKAKKLPQFTDNRAKCEACSLKKQCYSM